MDGEGCVASIMAIFLSGMLLFAGLKLWGYENGRQTGRRQMEIEAVQHGAAEYVIVDPAMGKTEFRWKDEGEAAD